LDFAYGGELISREQGSTEVQGGVVEVQPLGARIRVAAAETIFEAAWRSGYYWPTRCDGQAQCTFCCLEVESGASHALQPEEEEQLVLDRIRRIRASDAPFRLACRMKIKGDVVVKKDGVAKISEAL
jgi:2Fe-2S ferredoxin